MDILIPRVVLDEGEAVMLLAILEAVSGDSISLVELTPGESAIARSLLHRLRRAVTYGLPGVAEGPDSGLPDPDEELAEAMRRRVARSARRW